MVTPTPEARDEFQLRLGLLVLGALPLDEHLEVDQHLADCEGCRTECEELGELPGMLSLLSEDDLRGLLPGPVPRPRRVSQRAPLRPPGPGRVIRLPAGRRPAWSGTRLRVAAAAAVVVVGLGAGAGFWLRGAGQADRAPLSVAATDGSSGVRASIVVNGRDGGAHVEATVSGLREGVRYVLIAVASGGDTVVVARWTGTGKVRAVSADVALDPRELTFFSVAEDGGAAVVTVRIRAEPSPS
jgi:anti-sigma factor RsiW